MDFISQRFSRIAFITAFVLIVGWLISIRGFTAYRDVFGTPIGPDFLQFYTAATFLIEGKSESIYDFKAQMERQSLILHSPQEYLHAYNYPPLFAWVLQPFVLLDYRISFVAWSCVGLFILGAVGKWLRFNHYLSLSWFPVFAALSYGQSSFLGLGIIALMGWLWIEKRCSWSVGIVSGLLLYRPPLLVGFFLIFLILKEWKVIWGMGLSGIIYLILSFYFVPEETWYYPIFLIKKIPLLFAMNGFPMTQFFDAKGFFRLLFPQVDSGIQTALFLVVMVFFFRLFWIWGKSISSENKKMKFVGAILLLPWTIPYFLVYDWIFLLIAYGILKKESSIFEEDLGKKAIASLWTVALLSCPIAQLMMDRFGFAIQCAPLVLAYFTYRFYSSEKEWNLSE